MMYEQSKPMSTERVTIDGVLYDKVQIDRVTTIYNKVEEEKRKPGRPKVMHVQDAATESRSSDVGVGVSEA